MTVTDSTDWSSQQPLLAVRDLTVEFKTAAGTVKAVSDVSFELRRGETLGLVGESGCGKSTTGKALMDLVRPSAGSVELDGVALNGTKPRQVREQRRRMQMIFQDPISSLNPRRKIKDAIAEPLRIVGDTDDLGRRVASIMEAVGLDPSAGTRRPHEFSGGQCQRISIARALILKPEILICDEPVSALDVSVQAQILNLLEDLKDEFGLSYLFIAHDLAVVRNISDRVAVMYLGKICEIGAVEDVFLAPTHPYTKLLLASIPDVAASDAAVSDSGDIPSPLDPPSGCRFRTRCPLAQDRCATEEPTLRSIGTGDQRVACHFAESIPTTLTEVAK